MNAGDAALLEQLLAQRLPRVEQCCYCYSWLAQDGEGGRCANESAPGWECDELDGEEGCVLWEPARAFRAAVWYL